MSDMTHVKYLNDIVANSVKNPVVTYYQMAKTSFEIDILWSNRAPFRQSVQCLKG